MSLNDYLKCITKSESNIPVPKSSGRKKSKVRSQFPELQKYIETIINASNGCESEDASDKGEKTSKVGRSESNAMQNENKKVQKRKFNLNLNSENVKERTKTTVSVSSRENISNQFFSDFEDPRNWDIVIAQNDFHKNLKIEKALKTLFPNPYKLLQIPEFNKSKISMYIEKIGNDDVTLPDVIISEFHDQKTLHCTRVENIFEADYDKCSSQMDLWTLNSSSNLKGRRFDTCHHGGSTIFPDGFTLTSSFYKSLESDKNGDSANKQSLLENLKEGDSVRSEKKRAQDSFGRRRMSKNRKNSGEPLLDHDIGKLKLLTVTDSDDSSKDLEREKGKKPNEDFKNRIRKNESLHKFNFSHNGEKEAGMVKDFLSELNHKHKVNQMEVRNRSRSGGRERKTLAECKPKRKNFVKNSNEMNDSPKLVEHGFGAYEEPKFGKPSNNETKEKESNPEDGATVKPSEKIDEVLQFMCNCLRKFKNKRESTSGKALKSRDATQEVRGERWSKLDKPPTRKSSKSSQDLPDVEHLEVPRASFHSRRQNTSTFCPTEEKFQLVRYDRAAVRTPNVPDTVHPDSAAINNENVVQTVEIQNELGGYIEEQHRGGMSTRSVGLAKSILPLSVRIKKSKKDTYKVLKNALEREEGLLSGEFSLNELSPRNDFFEKQVDVLTEQSHASVIGAFKRQHSNFVICVNSLPRNARAGSSRGFSLWPWAISLDEIPRPIIQSLPYYQRLMYSEEPKLAGAKLAKQQAGRDETVSFFHRNTTSYVVTSIGVSFVMGSSKVDDKNLWCKSQSPIIIKYKPIKKSFHVGPSSPPEAIGCIIESCEKIDLDFESNLNDQVEALEEAVEETEVYFLEQNCDATYTVSETSTVSRSETFRSLAWSKESEKRKLHDLLMRTYNLQEKLHRHLKRLTDKPMSVSCPSIQQDETLDPLDFGVACRNSVLFRTVEKTSEDAVIYWSLQTLPKSDVLHEAVSVEVQTTDRATSYDPPPGEELKNIGGNADSDDDDRGSTYSFKSSNDFSEGEKELTMPRPEGNTTQVQFLKNIFNEIELFKNRIMTEKENEGGLEVKKDEKKDWTEKRLVESCEGMKTQTKVLKTVFKGKESLTELSLGLKAVPLAKVSNISVEKRKISENHTKISICISKEKASEHSQDRTTSKEMMGRRLSYLDSIRPSLSSCHTDHSRLENEFCREESEDDEDDFKSVVSTLSRPQSETNLFGEVKEVKKVETVAPKSFAKHRFDFYQKMDFSNKSKHKSTSNTSCTYKEFEPLKQALTEMQIRMRSIKRDAYFSSNDYYQRALKLAKMSAGYCQSCGSRSVIPQDTFGYYSTILPRKHSHRHTSPVYLKATPPHPSYYSLRSSVAELSDQFCDSNLRESSSYLPNPSRTDDIPIYSGRI